MLALLLDNIQKTMNTGALVRLAAATNAELQLAGASLHHSRRSARKASVGAEKRATISYPTDFMTAAAELRNRGFRLVAACTRGDVLYSDQDYRGPTAFLLGSEVAGLPAEAYDFADSVVYLPMVGEMESLNVGLTAAVLLYEALRQRGARG